MNKKVHLIVSKCVGSGDKIRTYGECILDITYDTAEEAMAEGKKHQDKGVGVLVRPNYNEGDGTWYREWRSFHGEPFKEVRFEISFVG